MSNMKVPHTSLNYRFGRWLIGEMQSRKVKAAEIAIALNITETQISRYKGGARKPTREHFHLLVKFFGMTPAEAAEKIKMTPGQQAAYISETKKGRPSRVKAETPRALYVHSFECPSIAGKMVDGSIDGEITIVCSVEDAEYVYRVWRSALQDVSRTTHVYVHEAIALVKAHYPDWTFIPTPPAMSVELTE